MFCVALALSKPSDRGGRGPVSVGGAASPTEGLPWFM